MGGHHSQHEAPTPRVPDNERALPTKRIENRNDVRDRLRNRERTLRRRRCKASLLKRGDAKPGLKFNPDIIKVGEAQPRTAMKQ